MRNRGKPQGSSHAQDETNAARGRRGNHRPARKRSLKVDHLGTVPEEMRGEIGFRVSYQDCVTLSQVSTLFHAFYSSDKVWRFRCTEDLTASPDRKEKESYLQFYQRMIGELKKIGPKDFKKRLLFCMENGLEKKAAECLAHAKSTMKELTFTETMLDAIDAHMVGHPGLTAFLRNEIRKLPMLLCQSYLVHWGTIPTAKRQISARSSIPPNEFPVIQELTYEVLHHAFSQRIESQYRQPKQLVLSLMIFYYASRGEKIDFIRDALQRDQFYKHVQVALLLALLAPDTGKNLQTSYPHSLTTLDIAQAEFTIQFLISQLSPHHKTTMITFLKNVLVEGGSEEPINLKQHHERFAFDLASYFVDPLLDDFKLSPARILYAVIVLNPSEVEMLKESSLHEQVCTMGLMGNNEAIKKYLKECEKFPNGLAVSIFFHLMAKNMPLCVIAPFREILKTRRIDKYVLEGLFTRIGTPKDNLQLSASQIEQLMNQFPEEDWLAFVVFVIERLFRNNQFANKFQHLGKTEVGLDAMMIYLSRIYKERDEDELCHTLKQFSCISRQDFPFVMFALWMKLVEENKIDLLRRIMFNESIYENFFKPLYQFDFSSLDPGMVSKTFQAITKINSDQPEALRFIYSR